MRQPVSLLIEVYQIYLSCEPSCWCCRRWARFALIGRICIFLALFQKVEWKPIPHTSTVKIDDLPVR